MAYATCEGAMLGTFSGVMNYLYPNMARICNAADRPNPLFCTRERMLNRL